MNTETTTRYCFEDRSSVTITKTSVLAELGSEKVHLTTLNEADLLNAVCSFIRCIKYRDSAEATDAWRAVWKASEDVAEYLREQERKASA